MEKVGTAEACDWCARAGTVRQHVYYGADGTVDCRNPSLCGVCFVFWNIPGDVEDAFYDAGVDLQGVVKEPLEAELARKWEEKVLRGVRSAE